MDPYLVGEFQNRRVIDKGDLDEELVCTITAESEDFISWFRPGRSVYLKGTGSTYHPAKICFGVKIDGNNKIRTLLESGVRP